MHVIYYNNQYIKVLYQIRTDECTHILLNHHFIKTMHHSEMCLPSKGLPLGLQLIQFSSSQQNDSPDIKFKLVSSV